MRKNEPVFGLRQSVLAGIRRAYHLTQRQAAEKAHRSQTAWSLYESGARKLPRSVMREIADVYGKEWMDVYDYAEKRKPEQGL